MARLGRLTALESDGADRAGTAPGHTGADGDQHLTHGDPDARGAAGPDGPPRMAVPGLFDSPTLDDTVVRNLMK